MKPPLFLCLKNPLTARDEERMGVAVLERRFDVRILDCTPWLMPAAERSRPGVRLARDNLVRVASLREFRAALGDAGGGFAIDYVGPFSPSAILMFDALKSRGVRIVVLDSGAFPTPERETAPRPRWRKVLDAFRHGGLRQHLNARANRLLIALLRDQRPDLALVSGTSWRADPRFAAARRQVEAHSFDYERFREVRRASAAPPVHGPYALYLDEDIAGHEDNAEMGLAAPASAGIFYPALDAVFARFESHAAMPIVIAGYPSRAEPEAHFRGRRVLVGRTAELIRDAAVVFAHASTAISFAVLWRRPLVFLTSAEIRRSWYQPWIEAPARLLRAPVVDVERWSPAANPALSPPDEAAFAAYEARFIKSPASPDRSLWDIFADAAIGAG